MRHYGTFSLKTSKFNVLIMLTEILLKPYNYYYYVTDFFLMLIIMSTFCIIYLSSNLAISPTLTFFYLKLCPQCLIFIVINILFHLHIIVICFTTFLLCTLYGALGHVDLCIDCLINVV